MFRQLIITTTKIYGPKITRDSVVRVRAVLVQCRDVDSEASSNERIVCPIPRGRCLPLCPHMQSLLQTRRWRRLPARKALASSGVIPIGSVVMGLPLTHQYFSSSCLPYFFIYMVASNAANSFQLLHASFPTARVKKKVLKYFRSRS